MNTTYLHPGKRLGSAYELEALVGTGQFGQVWRAKKLKDSSGVPVAVKVPLDPHRGEEVLMSDGQFMLDMPKHPGIVGVNWQGRVGKMWVVEMEYVNGEPLSQLMSDEIRWSKVTFEEIIEWFHGLAESLAFLHSHNIAHGDIKPDNLLMDEQLGRLKITDFGTSRRLTDNLIRTDRHAGAWAYQAPEIQRANQRGAISDLFSVGAVIYEVFTGSLPRSGIHELLTSSPITRPRQLNSAIPTELDQLVMDLLQDDLSKRLPTADVLRERLELLKPTVPDVHVPKLEPLPTGTGYLDRAAELIANGQKEEARNAAAEATLRSTGLVPALELYARLSDELGYTDDAINAFNKLLALEKTPSETRRSAESSLADLFLRLHRYEEAERYVELSLQQEHVTRSMQLKAAVVLGACTQLERSLQVLNAILNTNPQDGAVLEKKTWVLWLLHRYDDAAQVAREALEIMPESELCLRRLVDYESLTGNQRRAQHYRERLSQLEPV
ncbi:protein kinase domain-containing protein [Rubinisphaera italica]|uniref:Serine/threonine-protein kinase PrkC n=1 Tax=Rubinisphaera italica TaxID=2527969 RepID=A0A5C5XMK6_9PLAN|nr:serine/threonine-protein kinase [Rubinisphaera italica]TWT64397.1 Serine/threonine-protein kinase PrkC [Rubinisphaera italica]